MKLLLSLLSPLLIAFLASAPLHAQEAYKIKPGDIVRIEVLEDASINRETLVLPDGRVAVPLVGTIQAGGRSIDEVRIDLIERLRPNFAADPTVFVSLSQLAAPRAATSGAATGSGISIYMLGEVASPGIMEVKRGTTFLQALAQGGGVTRFGATKRLQLRRADASGKQQIYTYNVKDIIDGKSSISTPVLKEGDVIIVPQRRLFE
ncbi:polysaccharide biosynthesis/export family protein [Sedimentitalea sp. JM2-8]|uniref:Polysaccharide biosynthesis/export family protein n=1 Tax=Sedimentitalea xiamensis TaxID=3050037 RepID=A0ABT7FKM3_9RHOB|nr:polysaccharide biosynthesis/export family protein [Sedimentitalea xiamensis]MDK3075613.1 polysaccharide biosynthesis/export family protein [Sedimentitalea xiamensis]